MPDIEHLGKGALVDSPDSRDFKAESVMGTPIIDWNADFFLPEPPNNDQNGSSSCVAQAWSYYHWQLRNKDFSRRDLYARIFLPGGGAYIREGGLQIVKLGQATRDEVPDPAIETETDMCKGTGTPNQQSSDQELNSFVIADISIDNVAWAIEQYKGLVFGVQGSNAGWVDMANPRPAASNEVIWGHALYLFGRHMHNGLKCVIAKSSWGNSGNTTTHHIKENYFVSGAIFNPWTLIPKDAQSMTNSLIVQNSTEYGIYDPATSEDGLITLMRNRGMLIPLTPEGKLDWAQIKPAKQLRD